MRKVIVNSTPLLVLGNIGRLDILRSLYEQIEIPAAVYREVTEKTMPQVKLFLRQAIGLKCERLKILLIMRCIRQSFTPEKLKQ